MGKILLKIVAGLLATASLVYLLLICVEPDVATRLTASTRYDTWRHYWQQGHVRADLDLSGGLLPNTLPGPADQWAGSRPHEVMVNFQAPPGDYRLTLLFYDCHAAHPPLLALELNGHSLGEVRLPPGRGLPPPYLETDPLLTRQIDLHLDAKDNHLAITNQQGGWAALAGLRFSQGDTLNPAKGGYLLVAQKKLYLFPLLVVLALALFLWVAAQSGVGRAMAAVFLVTISCAVSFVVAEYAFREYLIRAPQARTLQVQRGDLSRDLKGMNLSFDKMIEPTPFMDITYQLRANLDGYFAGHPLRTNSQHMRSPEVSLAKPPGALRLMGLGDSVLFGWAVSAEEAMLSQLAGMLSQAVNRPVQELNMSCPSYNTAVEVAVYARRGRVFKPDVVVLLFVDNDFEPPSVMFEPVRRFTMDKSYIIEQLRRRFAAKWPDAPTESEALLTSQGGHMMRVGDKEAWMARLEAFYQHMTGKEAVAGGFKDLADMLAEDGALGVVAYYPNQLKPLDERVFFALEAARRAGLITLDMTPIFEHYLKEKGLAGLSQSIWVRPNDSHPNPLGHELMAQAVLQAIMDSGRLKIPPEAPSEQGKEPKTD